MPPAIPRSSVSRVERIVGYLSAALLPSLATAISLHSPALHNTPFALNFACVAAIATFFELGAALTAVLVNLLLFNMYILAFPGVWSYGLGDLLRSAIILAVGLLILFFGQRQRNIGIRLRAAHIELQEQTEAMIQAQQGSKSAAWVFSTKTRFTTWFKGGSEIFGRTFEEVSALGSPTSLTLEEDRPAIAAAAAHTTLTGETFKVEFRVLWPNGEVHWLEACGLPVPSDPSIWRGVTTDITDRKNAEIALVRSEKLAAAGKLAAAVAHEINNPLASVINLVYLARLTASNEVTSTYLETADKELARIALIANQTLQFHKQQSAPMAIDLVQTLDSLLRFYESRLTQAGILVETEYFETLPLCCFAGEIRQVVTNLIGNAVDAMPGGGTLRIRMRPATDWRSRRPAVRITVADTGNGMSAETRRHIFEPFFTTKGTKGTGLGLWVSSEIAQKHGGSLEVRSSLRPGRSGSVFTLILPYLPSAPVETADTSPRANPTTAPNFHERAR